MCIILCSLTTDELFIAIQPDEESRLQALKWIAENPLPKNEMTTIRTLVEQLIEAASGNLDKEVHLVLSIEVAIGDEFKPFPVIIKDFNITSNHPKIVYITGTNT